MKCGYYQLDAGVRRLAHASLGELTDLFEPWLRLHDAFGAPARNRLFSPSRTFWLFLSQVLAADQSCRETVRKFLAWLAIHEKPSASPKTGAYCRARDRLRLEDLEAACRKVAGAVQAAGGQDTWFGRQVCVLDGSSVSMPDTQANQAFYPQPTTQKPGCGFPVMRFVAAFSLATGAILEVAKGALHVSERTLFRQLWPLLQPADVVLADCGFCSLADFYFLGQKGVDSVMRNHQRRKTGIELVKTIEKGDRLIQWLKAKPCPKWLSREQWAAVPAKLLVREITFTVDVPGFRSQTLTIVTSLLDSEQFPKHAFVELYRRRWMVELYLRDIKTTMGMDVLRCKTPDRVHKELAMYLVAYNLIRALILEAAKTKGLTPYRLSFKGALAAVRQWAPFMASPYLTPYERKAMSRALLDSIARDNVPLRPYRSEPRARKRRPKNYQLLNKPRNLFKEIQHRNRYSAP